MNKYTNNINDLKANLRMVEGELYNFTVCKVKKSAKLVRKSLLNMMKICKQMRKDVQIEKEELPVRKRS